MQSIVSISIFSVLVAMSSHITAHGNTVNDRPIIGILAQEVTDFTNQLMRPNHYDSYIAASYVKFVEGAGARVVPIWIGKEESYYRSIMSKINGVLWPGGATSFTAGNGYGAAGEKIYKIAKSMNNRGEYFPIFAICLGFEMLTYLTANRQQVLVECNSENQAAPLEFTPEANSSRIFRNAPAAVIKYLKDCNVTVNFHHFCVTEKKLRDKGVRDKFNILSYNHDFDNKRFISSVESTEYPFYGLQFHPEKNLYEWKTSKNIPHSARASKVAQYFANFFVSEARKSDHSFKSEDLESSHLIYNYSPVYTALKGSLFQQCYMFKKSVK